MKIKKHIYSILPEIGHEHCLCDDGTYREIYTVHIFRDGFPYYSVCKDNLELTKTQANVIADGWNWDIHNLTLWGKIRYIFTGKR